MGSNLLELLAKPGGKPPTKFLLLKDGDIGWANLEGVELTEESATDIIAAFESHGVDLVIDYEHATPQVEAGGAAKAPAAGWIKGLRYVKGEGLYADPVEWTEGAAAEIAAREYRYSSPVILYDEETKAIKKLHSVALTNKPRTIGQSELLAAARLVVELNKETDMKKEKELTIALATGKGDKGLAHVLTLLKAQEEDMGDNMPAMSSDQAALGQLVATLNANGATLTTDATLSDIIKVAIDQLGGESTGEPGEVPEAEVARMKEFGLRLGIPISDETVPSMIHKSLLAAVDKMRATTVSGKDHADLQGRLATLEKERTEQAVAATVEKWTASGHLNPNDAAKLKWAKDVCGRKDGITDFETLMANAPKVWEPDTRTIGNDPGPKNGRESLIAANIKEWKDSPDAIVGGDCCAWVNQGLRDEDQTILTDPERKQVEVMAGK